MPAASMSGERIFPALLKYWRGRRGLSQLDLGLAAEVSARHISFLETGRSGPSKEMVLLLADVLDVPLRDRNELLRSAGFDHHYPDPGLEESLEGPLLHALEAMFAQHEPFPMMLIDRNYNVLLANQAGVRLAELIAPEPVEKLNLVEMLFDRERGRDLVVNWEEVALSVLRRLQREQLARPEDEGLRDLLEDLRDHPALVSELRQPDLGQPADPVVPVRLRLPDGRELGFLTTVTTFNAPQNVTLDELKIEGYFPLDEATSGLCRELFSSGA